MTMLQTAASSTEPRPTSEKTPRPAAAAQPSLTPSEQRLRAVIEAVPVSIIALKPEGDVLAANQAALELFGVKRLEELLGQDLKARVAPESRDKFSEFVGRVCQGEAGSLEYDLVRPDETRRSVETRAVILRREGVTGTAFLAATWEVSGRGQSKDIEHDALANQEALRTQCQALEESVREATASAERLAGERRVVEEALREAEAQIQNMRADAEAQRQSLAGGWAAERATLESKLRDVQEREAATRETLDARLRESEQRLVERDALEAMLREVQGRETAARESAETTLRDVQEREAAAREGLEAQLRQSKERETQLTASLTAEQESRQAEINRMEREYSAALADQATDIQQLERTVEDMRTSHEVMLVGARAERDELSAAIHDLERRYANLVQERDAEREELENQVRAGRLRSDLLVDVQDELRRKLASVAHALKEATVGAEHLLAECERARLLPDMNVPEEPNRVVQPARTATVDSDFAPSVDSPWTF